MEIELAGGPSDGKRVEAYADDYPARPPADYLEVVPVEVSLSPVEPVDVTRAVVPVRRYALAGRRDDGTLWYRLSADQTVLACVFYTW